ncbi:MAG: UvrB/UvrC motif-containing protein [Candidatus Sumerlaeia bacterium]|nr:UvrB/UvrC motif-containing protein [Candidatus Sumerlaeia bacterium]
MAVVICSKCQKRPAVVKLVRMVSGAPQTLTLCQLCAAETSPIQKQGLLQEAFEKLFAKLAQHHDDATTAEPDLPPCPHCGMTFAAYRKTSRLGCSECYSAFAGALEPQLEHIHGSTRHVGRSPQPLPQAEDQTGKIKRLQQALAEAVASEDFEKAAQLRDQIRQLKSEADNAVPKV